MCIRFLLGIMVFKPQRITVKLIMDYWTTYVIVNVIIVMLFVYVVVV